MGVMRKALILAIAAGALAVTGSRNGPITVGPRGELSPQALYSPQSKEHYLSTQDFAYVRPGYHITVNSITIPADLRPLVDVSFADDLAQPLDRNGAVTPGTLSASMVLAWYDGATRNYTAYTTRVQTSAPPSTMPGVMATQASADSGGTWTDLAVGHSTYKFKTALPAGFDPTKTTTLAIYGTRSTTDIVGKDYYSNVEYDFRPDGQAVTETWDVIRNDACNTCHNPLSAHGGSRQDVKLCVTCHSPQTTDPDTGNTVDFKVMIHKIHYGENLPSVKAGTPYQIIGFNQSVNDFSTVALPQDIRNCNVCHAAPAAGAVNWYIYPSRSACGSCHDDVNFVTGDNHPAGPQPDDSACSSCHAPVGREWDASIQGAHTVPAKSSQLKGINAKIVSVTNTTPGSTPTVHFQLTNGDGSPIDPSTLGTNLNLVLGGPTTDYGAGQNSPAQPFREAANLSAFDGTTATYTFTHAIPASAKGTWTVSIEARRSVTLDPHPNDGPTSINEGAVNPVAYIAVTDASPVSRRAVVDLAKCNTCHDKLALHGGQRLNTEECVICHNPNGDDSGRRPADQNPPESIDFKRLIHKIHRGENLTQDFTIYGFGNPPSVNNFNGVHFPGDLRDCETCHIPGTQHVQDEDPPGLLPTITQRDWYTPQQHYAAACLACHDELHQAAHAFIMTATFPNGVVAESCPACHGNDSDFSVDKIHAR
jgi:OmcA/MtrC family decaheme c-type cytochrome